MNDYKIGDVLYGKDGYNCTNVYFYRVISRTAKTLTIRQLESNVVKGDPMRTSFVVPTGNWKKKKLSDEFEEPFRVYLNRSGTAVVRGTSIFDTQYLDIWDGQPKWANTGFAG